MTVVSGEACRANLWTKKRSPVARWMFVLAVCHRFRGFGHE
jgi:hypothetical protein